MGVNKLNEKRFHLIGERLVYIGAIVFLMPVSAIFIGILDPYRTYYPSPTAISILTRIILLGLTMTGSGAIIL
ncbi:MAG: hypothetical protein P1Q69_09950 [Candidatus Thorarchaeota archaeon]|nr:hypothetical protein [Candidatus Thorarchaeota archaeon]